MAITLYISTYNYCLSDRIWLCKIETSLQLRSHTWFSYWHKAEQNFLYFWVFLLCKMISLQKNTRLNQIEEHSIWTKESHVQKLYDVIT